MKPEAAAEAPISGVKSISDTSQCSSAPQTAVAAKNNRNRRAPKRRASGGPKATIHTQLSADMGPGAVQQRVGQQRPGFRPGWV